MEFNWNLFHPVPHSSGLTNGALIALIALGYTLVYGIVELINFAHGEVFMMGAFFAHTVVSCVRASPGIPLAADRSGVSRRPARRDGLQRCASTGASTGSSTGVCATRPGWLH